MDNLEKLRRVLQHWIDHNAGHVAEFEKWRRTMAEEGRDDLARGLEQAKERMDLVSSVLADMLENNGGPVTHAHQSPDHHHHH